MEVNDCDSHFLFLGKTGVGKSTLSKILSEDDNIKIGNSMNPETNQVNSYICQIDGFTFSVIDTPGYDDSPEKDLKNYEAIEELLSSGKYKIKGIFYLFSFQDARFSESHRKGFQKIINLIPLDNFWEYFTIIFTKTFSSDDNLEELKNEKLVNLENVFEPLISAYHKTKNISLINFSQIKKVFVDLKKKTKKNDEQLNDLLNIFRENSKLSPIFHKLVIKGKEEKIFILNKDNKNKGKLYKCKIRLYKYYNNESKKPIKKIALLDRNKRPELIKEIPKIEFDGQFQRNCKKVLEGSAIVGGVSVFGFISCAIGSCFFPPLEIAVLILGSTALGSSLVGSGSFISHGLKNLIEYCTNLGFNSRKVTEEEEIIKEIENELLK